MTSHPGLPIITRSPAGLSTLVLLVTLGLAGCGAKEHFGRAEDRINAALPVAPEVAAAHQFLVSQLAARGLDAKTMEQSWAGRLKVRAVSCSRGYEPGFFTSASTIRARLDDTKCFGDADQSLLHWVGLQRVKLILDQGALRPLPKAPPALIGYPEYIQSIGFARNAPIAIVRGQRSMAVLDLTDGHELFSEAAGVGYARAPELSPNGRMFAQAVAGKVAIRGTERGEVLAEFPALNELLWVNNDVVLTVPGNGQPARIADLTTGDETPLTGAAAQGVLFVRPMPGEKDSYVLLGSQRAVQIDVVEISGRHEGRLRAEQSRGQPGFGLNTGGPSVDGKSWIDGSQALRSIDLATLEVEQVALQPLRIQAAWPTPVPGSVLIQTLVSDAGSRVASVPHWFVYEKEANTLAEVVVEPQASTRFVWMEAFKRLAIIDNQSVRPLASLATRDARPLAAVTAGFQDQINESRLAVATAAAATPPSSIVVSNHPGRLTIMTAPGAASSFSLDAIAAQSRLRDATVETVGVYQGRGTSAHGPNAPPTAGVVEVRVRRSSHPITLVLSSYQPVHWVLVSEPGASLAAVFVSSYYPWTVVGAGGARVLQIGQAYAYQRGTPAFDELQRNVTQWTGRPNMTFQGRYEGANFEVGGS